MLEMVRGLQWREVAEAIEGNPSLKDSRDKRGRNWLHLCCGVRIHDKKLRPADSIKTASVLLDAGLELNAPAFTEGSWKATPLWYAISFGRNLELARYLLDRGSDPEHCMWAAAFNDDAAAIRLLARYGAKLDGVAEDASPFFFAVQWSHFVAAEQLLKLGADVNFQNSKGLTAFHLLLKKNAPLQAMELLIHHGARGGLKDKTGCSVLEILERKRSPDMRRLAERLRTRSGT
jgi:ankyrin repeat protein